MLATDKTFTQDQVRIIHKSPLVPPPPLAYSTKLSKSLREKIKAATLEAHNFGKIKGWRRNVALY